MSTLVCLSVLFLDGAVVIGTPERKVAFECYQCSWIEVHSVVKLDKAGYPVAITPRDFFAFLEALTAYNNRTQAVKDKALVLEG